MSGRWTAFGISAATICAALGSSSAAAQTAVADDAPAAVEEVVVTGVREQGYRSEEQSAALFGSVELLDTPFQVSVFPIELLQDQQVRTLFDVAKNDASVVANDAATGFYDSVAIRGFTLSNSSGYYREGLLYQNQAQSPFENKAAVEIVKGLTGLRYGFTAPGGVVNYVLKRPTAQPYRAVDLFGDSNGGFGAHVDVGGPITEKLGFRFNGVLARDALFVDGVEGPRRLASLFLSWRPTDRLTIDLEGEYQFRELEQNATIRFNSFDANLTNAQKRDILDRYDRSTYLGQDWTTYPTHNAIGSIKAQYRVSDDWRLRAAVQKMHLDRDQNSINIAPRSINAAGDFTAQLYYAPDQIRDPLTVDVAVEGAFSTGSIRHEVVAGVYHLNNRLTFPYFGFDAPVGRSNLFSPVVIADPNVTSDPSYTGVRERQTSFYATDHARINEQLNVLAGVRYTKPKFETFFNEDLSRDTLYEEESVTFTGGLVFKPVQAVSLYASYAEGFEQGGQAPSDTVNANQVLPPLTSSQYEVGIKAELFEGATLSAAAFEIDKGLELIDAANRFVQDGRQVHRGIEASLAGQLTPRLRVVTGVQYVDAKVERAATGALIGKRPVNVPEWQANLFVDWRLPVEHDIAVNGGVYVSDDKFADNLNTFAVDGYVRLDLGARYAFDVGDARATARLVVENVTDDVYFTGVGFGTFQYASPRTARVSLSTSF